jgi:hypothetical protein
VDEKTVCLELEEHPKADQNLLARVLDHRETDEDGKISTLSYSEFFEIVHAVNEEDIELSVQNLGTPVKVGDDPEGGEKKVLHLHIDKDALEEFEEAIGDGSE